VTGLLVRRWRPDPLAWVLIAACIVWPSTILKTISGNPNLWVMMLVAMGLAWRWPGALVLLKPSFLPLALIGVNSRGWWLALGTLVVLSLPFLADTLTYPLVIMNSRSPEGVGYSLWDVPTVLPPIFGWLMRTRAAK